MRSPSLILAMLICGMLVSLAVPASAAEPDAAAKKEAQDELTISLLTFSPGDEPFFKFGHNAIWVHDGARGRDLVYNFGTFAFDSPLLIPEFLKGKLRYWLSVQSLAETVWTYRAENRSIAAQELELTAAQKQALASELEVNALPENAAYKYDYYLDNCSTRVRDPIDRVLGGALRAVTNGPASMSWRDHTRRLTADLLWEYFGLDIVMADFIDQPITEWDEMFLPGKLQEYVRRVQVPRADALVPLVKSERVLLTARRPPSPPAPPRWLGHFALLGAGMGAALYGLGSLARRAAIARWVLGFSIAGIGGLLGLLGTIFVLLWAFTDHAVAFGNENILQCAPWVIALIFLGPGVARGRAAAVRRSFWLSAAAAALSLLGLLLKPLPLMNQTNAEFIALLLPMWTGMAAGLTMLGRAPPDTGTGGEPPRLATRQKR